MAIIIINEYIYVQKIMPNIATTNEQSGETSGIHFGIIESIINNKGYHHCEWNSITELLSIFFEQELSVEEKNVLDLIVRNYA